LHYEWAGKNKKPFQRGLAGQFQEIEQVLSVSQEEDFAQATEDRYLLDVVETDYFDDPMG
jgi:hypothetical protein